MKRVLWILVFCGVLGLLTAQAEVPLGFGYINTNRTNVRQSPGGPIAARLDDGDAVFIVSQETDAKGDLWYCVNTEYNGDRPHTVWVMARYVTAGGELFSDVVQIAAGSRGLLALRRDGTVTGAANENYNARIFRDTIAKWRNVRQVTCGFMTYVALLEDGTLRGFGNMAYEDWNSVRDVRLLDGKDMEIQYVTENGTFNRGAENTFVALGRPLDWQNAADIAAGDFGTVVLYPDGTTTALFFANRQWEDVFQGIDAWDDMAAVHCGEWTITMQGIGAPKLYPLLAGLHLDGTVSTLPRDYYPELETWTEIKDVKAGWDFVLGLRGDGTVAVASKNPAIAEQVALWPEVVAIDAAMGYCVGLTKDGTLVFAGDFIF